MCELEHILEKNTLWAKSRVERDSEYFSRLAKIQNPKMLWIGCSDSRVSANVITGLDPGEVFVHRNIANLVYGADVNCMSVVQYAVDALKIEHIIVCGHFGCGGVHAAYKNKSEGLIDHWLEPVKDLARRHEEKLRDLPDDEARINYLCEQNVREQLFNLAHTPIIRRARARGQKLKLHGWIYSLENGLLRDLCFDEVNQVS